MTFQFLMVVVVGAVLKVSSLDRVQQRFVEQIATKIQFLAVEVFKVLARDRLQVLHPRICLVLRMRLLLFFRTLPDIKKMRGWARTRGRNCPRSRAPPRGELMPCPWFPRTTSQRRSRSPRSRRTATSGWMGPGVSG